LETKASLVTHYSRGHGIILSSDQIREINFDQMTTEPRYNEVVVSKSTSTTVKPSPPIVNLEQQQSSNDSTGHRYEQLFIRIIHENMSDAMNVTPHLPVYFFCDYTRKPFIDNNSRRNK
jgi:hypothetical protein